MKFLERFKKFWYIPFALLAVIALAAASPTPRKILSENFTDWIRIYGDQPYIYMDRENDSGVFYGVTVWRDLADNIEFYMGGYGIDEDWLYWLVHTPGGYGIVMDTEGDVGIKKTPSTGMALDVSGDLQIDKTSPALRFKDGGIETGNITVVRTGEYDQSYIEFNVRTIPGRPMPPNPAESVLTPVGVLVAPDANCSVGHERGMGAVDFGTWRNDSDDIASGDYATISGGGSNRASSDYSTVGGGRRNVATNTYAVVSGGNENVADATHSTVGGGHSNLAQGDYSVVGGGSDNLVGSYGEVNPVYSGVASGIWNQVYVPTSFIGGGQMNAIMKGTVLAGGEGNAIVGGEFNTIRGGGQGALYSFIGGGFSNDIYYGDPYSVIVGGFNNTLYKQGTIGGGSDNEVGHTGGLSAIPGGSGNFANGRGSTVLGIKGTSDMFGEVAMGSNNDLVRHSLLQMHRETRLTGTWQSLSLTGGGIYKIEGAAQELFDRAVLLFSRVTTEYEDDESWDVQMTVEYRTGTTPDWVKIQIVDIGGGDDDVEVIATIRMARIDTYGG